MFGPGVPSDEVFGPVAADWWELLETTGRAWRTSTILRSSDPDRWADAAADRLALLADRAPHEVSGPIETLRRGAGRYISAVRDGRRDIGQGDVFDDGAEQAAIDELGVKIADHFTWQTDRRTVVTNLLDACYYGPP